jgi:hypothetical protein
VLSPAAEARRRWLRGGLVALAGFYLLTVWLDGVGSNIPSKFLPRPWVYFAQVAALFVNASPKSIDYRAEGWSCSERKWIEIDTAPYFPIDADNKENRFQRALQFYRKNRTVMRSLEDFLLHRYNESPSHAPIGGVRFLSLRLPYPAPGEKVERVTHRALASYPKDVRHDWYWTPKSRRAERCGYKLGPKDDDPDEKDPPKDFAPDPKEKDPEP